MSDEWADVDEEFELGLIADTKAGRLTDDEVQSIMEDD
jgi:hypothetical protein